MPNDPEATSWSVTGAIIAAARANPATATYPPFTRAMNALAAILGEGPQSWNDKPGRAQNDVLAALTAALNLLLREQTKANPSPQRGRAASGFLG